MPWEHAHAQNAALTLTARASEASRARARALVVLYCWVASILAIHGKNVALCARVKEQPQLKKVALKWIENLRCLLSSFTRVFRPALTFEQITNIIFMDVIRESSNLVS